MLKPCLWIWGSLNIPMAFPASIQWTRYRTVVLRGRQVALKDLLWIHVLNSKVWSWYSLTTDFKISVTAFCHHPTYILLYIKQNPQVITYIPYCLYRKSIPFPWLICGISIISSFLLILSARWIECCKTPKDLFFSKHFQKHSTFLQLRFFSRTHNFKSHHQWECMFISAHVSLPGCQSLCNTPLSLLSIFLWFRMMFFQCFPL